MLAAVMGVLLFSVNSVIAGPFSYNFNTPTGTLGTTQTYTAGGVTITALGFNSSNSPIDLYGKNDGGDESGLGLVGTSDHEITTSNYVQLDLQNIYNQYPTATLSMILGSVQDGESGKIYGSNTAGALGTFLFTVSDESSFNVPGGYRYIGVEAGAADVLITTLSVNAVPVPPGVILALTGVALCGGYSCRRRKAAA
jgi:hypothetical protein